MRLNMNKAYYITAEKLAECQNSKIPKKLISSAHLIYSSPATLAFNSPGAQGFGVKRAGLAIPGSVELLVSPGCCGRNTTMLNELGDYGEKFFYMLMDDTDIVTGRHLVKIPAAVKEICETCETVPSAVMICITCVDALLGTDMERVCKKASKQAGIPVLPCYMYALTREGRLPPMVAVRKSIYSLLKPIKKTPDAINILGYFAPLDNDCELYHLLNQAGIQHIREISRCKDFEEYMAMAQANFNLVLNQEARYAAQDMQKKLKIPSIELNRMYQLDKIQNQYRLLGQIIGAALDDQKYYDSAFDSVEKFRRNYGSITFAVGEMVNANAFELSLALIRYGFAVSEIYGTVGGLNFAYIKKIAQLSPQTKIYSNLSPTMLYYDAGDSKSNVVIGRDAQYYHPDCTGIAWNEERQPFGYAGVRKLFDTLDRALKGEVNE
jgi:nitrogenase molybdenum-cofactor synthesis protein NifE